LLLLSLLLSALTAPGPGWTKLLLLTGLQSGRRKRGVAVLLTLLGSEVDIAGADVTPGDVAGSGADTAC